MSPRRRAPSVRAGRAPVSPPPVVNLCLERHLARLDATTEAGDAIGYCAATDALLGDYPNMPGHLRAELLRRRRMAEFVGALATLGTRGPQ